MQYCSIAELAPLLDEDPNPNLTLFALNGNRQVERYGSLLVSFVLLNVTDPGRSFVLRVGAASVDGAVLDPVGHAI